jgi:general L-amino acid transport system permease protein
MSSNEAVQFMPRPAARRPPPQVTASWVRRIRLGFFDGWMNGLTTLLIAWALFVTLPRLIRWAIVDAVWFTRDAADCRAAAGACWAVVPEKYRVMLFGTFPYDEQWRGVLVVAIILVLAVVSGLRKFPARAVLAGWAGGMALVFLLMSGGMPGLTPIATHQWSGLPLTLIMFVGTIAGGVPLGVVLALGRRSGMPVIKALCVGFIEIVRGLPLVTVLFMASLMIPLFLPGGFNFDKVLRAQIAMTLFFAAYAAEIVRGGLQVIGRGQYEAADAIGLTYRQKMTRVILPQVARVVLPPMMNEIIRAFKNTTFIGIIGLFDVLRATSTAIQDPVWVQYSIEAYLFILLMYFAFCFAMSKYSQRLELEMNSGHRS